MCRARGVRGIRINRRSLQSDAHLRAPERRGASRKDLRSMWRHPIDPRSRQFVTAGVAVLGCVLLAGCMATSTRTSSRYNSGLGVSASPRVIPPGQPIPKGGGVYRVGHPYVVGGRTYYPSENHHYRHEGIASWYGDDFHGRLTANGEIYDMEAISAAHPTLPMPCYARVTNLRNGRSLVVRVNDRGPYHADREIDLSGRAADLLGFRGHGLARVRVEYVGPASLDGSDDRRLMATLRQGSPAPMPSAVALAAPRPFVPHVSRPVVARRPVEAAENEMAPEETAPPVAPRPRMAALRPPLSPMPQSRVVAAANPRLEGAEPQGSGPRMVWTTGPQPASVAVTTGHGLY
jgi:rare lipoprotein A